MVRSRAGLTRLLLCLSSALMTVACQGRTLAHMTTAPAEATATRGSPTAGTLFDVILLAIAQHVQTSERLRVDARPFRNWVVSPVFSVDMLDDTDSTEVRVRQASLRRLGFESADLVSLDLCGGTEVVFDPAGVHRGCPSRGDVLAAVGGTKELESSGQSIGTVPVIVVMRYPTGGSAQQFNVVVARSRSGKWYVEKLIPGMVVE